MLRALGLGLGATWQEDLEGTQKELDAALAYFDKLKPSCVDSGVSYEDRVARRKEEIESLQEALKILNGEDMAIPSPSLLALLKHPGPTKK